MELITYLIFNSTVLTDVIRALQLSDRNLLICYVEAAPT